MVQSIGVSFICWGGVGRGGGYVRLLRVSQEVFKLSLQMTSAMKRFGFNSWKSLICKDVQDYVHIIPWNYVQSNPAYGYLVWRPSSQSIYQLF